MPQVIVRNRWKAIVAVVTSVVLLLPVGMSNARRRADYTPGSPGLGDSYYPLDGNGGYDVRHYVLRIRYKPVTDRLRGKAHISATAKKNLSRFNLDFQGLNLRSISVNGEAARWIRRRRHELVISPSANLGKGKAFEVVASYAGIPKLLGGGIVAGGVHRTTDGAVIVGQPHVASTWFPVNDHPRDRATFTVRLEVPSGVEAVSNGRLVKRSSTDGWSTWTWSGGGKMASYLATAAIGQFEIGRRTTSEGIPVLDAVDVQIGNRADRVLAKEEAIVGFLSQRFGPYPFEALGAIVERHDLGFALETQTRPVYDSRIFTEFDSIFATSLVVHELAHMWYGDSVAVRDWRHIWLNEGPATYAEWLWSGSRGGDRPGETFDSLCSAPGGNDFWDVKTGDPGRRNLFDPEAVYLRGAMTLHALRRAVGTETFFEIMSTWTDERGGRTGTSARFKRLAEELSGRQLDRLFRHWLLRAAKPPGCRGAGKANNRGTTLASSLWKGTHTQ